MRYHIALACGQLSIRSDVEQLTLWQLLGFATRRNPKRGFLFVSRVLGKHIPCPPQRMRNSYQRLVAQLPCLPGPVLTIGMAETATGLGAGVADSLARQQQRADVLYQHTTRHDLAQAQIGRFEESHSHATEHQLYIPLPELADDYYNARSLVLVDDEITTGRTLVALAQMLAARALPKLQQVWIVTLVDWLSPERRAEITQTLAGVQVQFVSLLRGQFEFTPDPSWQVALPLDVDASRPSAYPPYQRAGRRGIRMTANGPQGLQLALPQSVNAQQPVTVLGVGEFAYLPFLLAEQLAERGQRVCYQSTTRSPILPGGAIAQSLQFADEYGEGVSNYLHNPPVSAPQVLVCYEQAAAIAQHQSLLQQLPQAQTCYLAQTGDE